MVTKIPKTAKRQREEFDAHLRSLKRSALAYDEGDYDAALPMSATIVTLIGDRVSSAGKVSKNFISSSTSLGIKPTDVVCLSDVTTLENEEWHGPFCSMGGQVAGSIGLTPWLDWFENSGLTGNATLPFDQWWNGVVLRDCVGNEFTRRNIVETMRDQEGAHSDDTLDEAYAGAAYGKGFGVISKNPGQVEFDTNPARVVVRQVAQEVLRTFKADLPVTYTKTGGRKIAPWVLARVTAFHDDGTDELVRDHRAMHFDMMSTSNPLVWSLWNVFDEEVQFPTQPHEKSSRFAAVKRWAVQCIFLNHAPYELEVAEAKLQIV